jgi:hypothetical protein
MTNNLTKNYRHYRASARNRPRGCGGPMAYEGSCGAPDCPTCHPEWQGECPECGWRGYADDAEGGKCPECGDGGEG